VEIVCIHAGERMSVFDICQVIRAMAIPPSDVRDSPRRGSGSPTPRCARLCDLAQWRVKNSE